MNNTTIRMATIKTNKMTSVGKALEKLEPLCIIIGIIKKGYNLYANWYGCFSKN